MEMVPQDSTSIAAAGYDAARKVLRIRFVSGRTYDYLDVPAEAFEALKAAESKGRFVNYVIKPRFKFRKVS